MRPGQSLRATRWVGVVAALAAAPSAFGQERPPIAIPGPTASGAAAAGPTPPRPAVAIPPSPRAPVAIPAPSRAPVAIPAPADDGAPNPENVLRAGVVALERGGRRVALGVVLGGDGRVLTAHAALGGAKDVDVRYADGTKAKATVGAHDAHWDLVLLTPEKTRPGDGLVPSTRDPGETGLAVRLVGSAPGKLRIAAATLKGRRDLRAADGTELPRTLEIGTRVQPYEHGAPLVDAEGRVLGVVARGCAARDDARADRPCVATGMGVPNEAIRAFLKNARRPPVRVEAPAAGAWLGVQGVADARGVAKGVRVLAVHPKSPAAGLGLAAGPNGDVVLAIAGTPVPTPDELAAAVRAHTAGEKVSVTWLAGGRYRTAEIELAAGPEGAEGSARARKVEIPTTIRGPVTSDAAKP